MASIKMEEKNQNQEQGLTTEEVKAQIAEVIANAKENREKVRKESKSGELKRNPFVNLDEKGILNPDAIVKDSGEEIIPQLRREEYGAADCPDCIP